MRIHLVNPSDISFGTAVITPRWLYVLAAATPREYGDPRVVDETLDPIDFDSISSGDVVGIGIHTFNALRGYEIGREARKRGATVVFGGIHPTLYPGESHELGGAHAVVKGDGDVIWASVLADCTNGKLQPCYDGGRVNGTTFQPARWDLLPAAKYMWGSVQTLRGCPKHCSFCSVWRTDGQQPRQRAADAVVREIVELRRMGFRFILLSDDNFYPVTVEDLRLAERQGNTARIESLNEIRRERFELMELLAKLPDDLVFYTQITMEAAEDTEFLQGDEQGEDPRRARRRRIGDAGRIESDFQGFQLRGRSAGYAPEGISQTRRAHPGVVHFRLADRQGRHVCRDSRARAARGHRLCAVHHADAVSRHRRFREMGREDGVRPDGIAGYPLTRLADPA